jgi:hypothetical protein
MPHRAARKTREPERDYSHRSLLEKLGVKSGQRVCVLGVADQDFLLDLAVVVPNASRGKPQKETDLIFLAAASLSSRTSSAAAPSGLSIPKASSTSAKPT